MGTVELSGAAEVTIFLSAVRMQTGGLEIYVAVVVAVTAAISAAAAVGIGGCAIVQACWRCSSVSLTGMKVQRSSRVNTGSN